jgi:ubiquitin carboxyl-terminal hydrolase 25/28
MLEVSQRMRNLPEKDRYNKPTTYEPIIALTDLQKALGIYGYPKVSRAAINAVDERLSYASLGSTSELDDALTLYAYRCQREWDLRNKAYYFECLTIIAKERKSADLEEEVAIAQSLGEETQSTIDKAYNFFGLDVDDQRTTDEHILGLYASRSEDAPKHDEEAKMHLQILGKARNSQALERAGKTTMTYEDALEYLGFSRDFGGMSEPDADAISATVVVAVSNNR